MNIHWKHGITAFAFTACDETIDRIDEAMLVNDPDQAWIIHTDDEFIKSGGYILKSDGSFDLIMEFYPDCLSVAASGT